MPKALALDNFSFPFFSKTKSFALKNSSVNNNRFYLALGLIAINSIMLFSYILGVNNFASQGYQIKALQKQLSVLSEDNKKISLKVSEANSMVAIQSGFLSANFVAEGTPKFLEVIQNQFTQR